MSESSPLGIHLCHETQPIGSFAGPTRKAVQIWGNVFSTEGAKILWAYEYVLEKKWMTRKVEESQEAAVQINVEQNEEVVLGVWQNSLRVKRILDISPNDFVGIVKIALALKQITIPPEIAPWVKPKNMTGANLLVTIMWDTYHITSSWDVWTTTRWWIGWISRNKEKLKTPLHVLLPEFLQENLQKWEGGKESMNIAHKDGKPVLECVTWKWQTVRVAQNWKVYLIDWTSVRKIGWYKEEWSLIMPDTLAWRVSFPHPHASIVTLWRWDDYMAETRIDLGIYPQWKVEIQRLGISPTWSILCSAEQIEFFRKFPTLDKLNSTSDADLKKLVKGLLALSNKK